MKSLSFAWIKLLPYDTSLKFGISTRQSRFITFCTLFVLDTTMVVPEKYCIYTKFRSWTSHIYLESNLHSVFEGKWGPLPFVITQQPQIMHL